MHRPCASVFAVYLPSRSLAIALQVKNVGSDELEGKVGRIYMPAQDVGSMALHKMKVRHAHLPCFLLGSQSGAGFRQSDAHADGMFPCIDLQGGQYV